MMTSCIVPRRLVCSILSNSVQCCSIRLICLSCLERIITALAPLQRKQMPGTSWNFQEKHPSSVQAPVGWLHWCHLQCVFLSPSGWHGSLSAASLTAALPWRADCLCEWLVQGACAGRAQSLPPWERERRSWRMGWEQQLNATGHAASWGWKGQSCKGVDESTSSGFTPRALCVQRGLGNTFLHVSGGSETPGLLSRHTYSLICFIQFYLYKRSVQAMAD